VGRMGWRDDFRSARQGVRGVPSVVVRAGTFHHRGGRHRGPPVDPHSTGDRERPQRPPGDLEELGFRRASRHIPWTLQDVRGGAGFAQLDEMPTTAATLVFREVPDRASRCPRARTLWAGVLSRHSPSWRTDFRVFVDTSTGTSRNIFSSVWCTINTF
jgi:hypothetical protein